MMVTPDQSGIAVVPSSWADPVGPPVPAPRPTLRGVVPLLVWLGALGAAVGLLVAMGEGRLAAPSLVDPLTWSAWAQGRDPVEVAMVVARLGCLGLAWYLVGVTSVSVLARLCRAARLVRLADAMAVGPVRVLVQQALGMSLATGVLVSAVPVVVDDAAAGSGHQASAEAQVLAAIGEGVSTGPANPPPLGEAPVPAPSGDHAAPSSVVSPSPAAAPSPIASPAPVLSPSPVVAPSPVAAPSPAPVATTSPAPVESPQPAAVPATPPANHPQTSTVAPARPARAVEVRVAPGEHFWSLAERAVAEHLGRPGSEAEVLEHWRTVVAANADRLTVPGNADLLLPGQVVVVPAVVGGAP